MQSTYPTHPKWWGGWVVCRVPTPPPNHPASNWMVVVGALLKAPHPLHHRGWVECHPHPTTRSTSHLWDRRDL